MTRTSLGLSLKASLHQARVANLGRALIGGQQRGLHEVEPALVGQFLESLAAERVREILVDRLMGLLGAGAMTQRFDDMRARLLQRLDVSELVIFDLDDVVTVLGLYDRQLARLHRKGRVGKRLHHLALLEIAEVAAAVPVPGVIGELLGELGEVGSALDLLQKVFGLGFGGGLLSGRGVGRDRDQNVARADLFRMGQTGVALAVVVILDFLVGGIDLGRELVWVVADEVER